MRSSGFLQCLFILSALLAKVSSPAAAEESLWDLGAGISGVQIPHYTGSDEVYQFVLPFPYFVYRGEKLKVDRNFVHGIFFEQGNWRAEMSFSGSPPLKSRDDDAREGMPDLDAIAEVGPVLMYNLSKSEQSLWRLELPVRTAIATDFHSASNEGLIIAPMLRFNRRWENQQAKWLFESALSFNYGSNRYHDYFYAVDPAYANQQRPAYDAESGYAGWRWTMGASRQVRHLWAGAFVRYIDLHDAVFADSPLVKAKESWLFGFAVAWIFHSSDKSAAEWCSSSNSDLSATC